MSKKDHSKTSAPAMQGFTEGDLSEIKRTSLALTTVIFCLFVAFIYGYSRFGGEWVDSLDDRLGEVVATRARSLADAGAADDAIALYRQSFTLRFEDPKQRIWNAQRFLSLLVKEGEYAEASEFAREMLSIAEDGEIYSQLVKSLREQKRHDEVDPVAEAWYAFSKERADSQSMASAKFAQGWALSSLGRKEEALAAHLQGTEAHRMAENPRAAAEILISLDRSDEALPLLESVIETGSDAEVQNAKRLRARIIAP